MKLINSPLIDSHKFHQNSRIFSLAIASIFIVATLGKLAVIQPKDTTNNFIFPLEISLPGWQISKSSSPVSSVSNASQAPNFISGRGYQYVKNNLNLDIDIQYISGGSGDVREYTKIYLGIPHETNFSMRKHESIGYYYQFSFKKRAYLSTCINPHGSSTINPQQFKKARFSSKTWPNHILPILLGQESFWDDRCLWVQLSVPSDKLSTQQAYQTLDSAFVPWFHWWSKNYPKP